MFNSVRKNSLLVLFSGLLLCTSCKKQSDSAQHEGVSPNTAEVESDHSSENEVSVIAGTDTEDVIKEKAIQTFSEDSSEQLDAYAKALALFKGNPTDTSSLEAFIKLWPSGSSSVLARNTLSKVYFNKGLLADYLKNGRAAWEVAKQLAPSHDVTANQSYSDYAWALAFFGKKTELSALIDSVADRPVTSHAAAFQRAQESLVSMQENTESSHLCGPHSLFCILQEQGNTTPDSVFQTGAKSSSQGMNFAQVAQIASEVGMPYQVARVNGAAEVPVPSVISWSEGHFSAVVRRTESGKVVVQDSMFRQPLIVEPSELLSQSSGYFLVHEDMISDTLVAVSEDEAATVWGAHTPVNPDEDDKDPCKDDGCGMAVFGVDGLHCDLRLRDTPLLYQPAFGPGVSPTLTYNYLSTNQPGIFHFGNLGPNWNLNWMRMVVDNPSTPEANVFLFQPNGGGGRHFQNDGLGSFARDARTLSSLNRMEDDSYMIDHVDGSREIFGVNDNGAVQRCFFLTEYIDPQGNSVKYQYDDQLRLVSVLDATGKTSTLAYDHPTDALKITSISDPYGRTAVFTYNATGRLESITDVIGITSSFSYLSDGFVEKLTTPYGDTKFDYESTGRTRTLTAELPNGDSQRWQHWLFSAPTETLSLRGAYRRPNDIGLDPLSFFGHTTYYWDRKAFKYHENDATMAVATAYLFAAGNSFSSVNVTSAVKNPLEDPVYFTYPGQTSVSRAGTLDRPERVLRLLPDGTTQESLTEYNELGLPTRTVDPLGRETRVAYHPNNIDVLSVKQVTAVGEETLMQYPAYQDHRLLSMIDAAGQQSSYTYNDRGQLLTSTDPLNRVTTVNYKPGDASVTGFGKPESINSYRADNTVSYTYDALERVATTTNVDAYVTAYTYDNFDRPLTTTFMDNTQMSYEYLHLDLLKTTDREGRSSVNAYDSIRQLTSVTDAEGRINRYVWCRCGGLEELTDAQGRTTKWDLDLQGRLTKKTLPDGRNYNYTYDSVNRMLTSTDPLGQSCNYTYNIDNTVAAKDFTNAVNPTVGYTYTYDPAYNRLTQVTDQYGATTLSYHAFNGSTLGAGQVASMDGPWENDTCVKTYDELGRLVSDQLPSSPMSYN